MRAAATALALFAIAAAAGEGLTDEESRTLRWFDSLGYPDLGKLPFVRFYGGAWQQVGNDPPEAVAEYGFLLSDDGKTVRIFTVGLATITLQPTGAGTPAHERVRYEKAPLDEYVRDGLRHLANPPEEMWPSFPREPFGHLEYAPRLWFRLLVFADACARQGHPALAHELLRVAETHEDFDGASEESVLAQLREQVASEALRGVMEDFGDHALSWSDLLSRCKWWKGRFGGMTNPEWVDSTIPMIEAIVRGPATEPRDPVEKLILRLCDTRDMCWQLPAPDPAGAELVRLGVAAVPKLLDAWGDRRPTRCAGSYMSWQGYERPDVFVMNVGDVVRAILEEIAARRFESLEEAAAWYRDVRALGEHDVLVREIRAGGREALRAAARLKERYPESAEAAILAGIATAKDGNMRLNLVVHLQTVRTATTDRFLLEESRSADAGRRAMAAWLLLLRGNRDGIAPVVEAWRSGESGEAVRDFLCACGDAGAIAALEERFEAVPTYSRLDIVLQFVARTVPYASQPEWPAVDAGWDAAVEKLLVRALGDGAHNRGMGLSFQPYQLASPRNCDVAACVLAARWPDRYEFDPLALVGRRDRRIAELANRWRTAQGLEPLPVPELFRPKPLPEAVERELEASKDFAAIERAGLSALPLVARRLAATAADDPARAPLEDLRRRLLCRVTSVDAPEDPGGVLGALKERPLTAPALVAALVALANSLPEGVTGYSLSVGRADDGTGIAVWMRLERGSARGDSKLNFDVVANRRQVAGLYGTGDGRSPQSWRDLPEGLAEVLGGEPSAPFEARVWIGPREE